MEKTIDINEFENKLKKEDCERIYRYIVNASIELANKIAKIKNIRLNDNENIEDRLFDIEFAFKKNCASFREIIYLMKDLREWNYEDAYDDEILVENENRKIFFTESKEEKVKSYIKRYNLIVLELNEYYSIEKGIKENGYKKFIEQRTEKLIQLFKEMLNFKNKEYDENWNLIQFVEKISEHYSFYLEQLENVVSAVNMGSITCDISEETISINEVETIMIVDDFYNQLTCDDEYKTQA